MLVESLLPEISSSLYILSGLSVLSVPKRSPSVVLSSQTSCQAIYLNMTLVHEVLYGSELIRPLSISLQMNSQISSIQERLRSSIGKKR